VVLLVLIDGLDLAFDLAPRVVIRTQLIHPLIVLIFKRIIGKVLDLSISEDGIEELGVVIVELLVVELLDIVFEPDVGEPLVGDHVEGREEVLMRHHGLGSGPIRSNHKVLAEIHP